MQLFRSQLSKFIPHPHRDSWMRNNLADWLQILRIASFLILSASAWNIFRTCSPIGVENQFLPLLQSISQTLAGTSDIDGNGNGKFNVSHIEVIIRSLFIALFFIASLTGFRCGTRKRIKYILPVLVSSLLIVVSTIHHVRTSDYEVISIVPYVLPISIPVLLLSYRPLANKLDHWNAYATFGCIITIFGNAVTYIFFPEKFPHLNESIFTSIGLPASSGATIMTVFSYFSIICSLLTTIVTTRRLGLFTLIGIGAVTCLYRIISLSLSPSTSASLIITDVIFYTSYWIIPMLILLSLASRRKTQTLKI